MLCLVLKSVTGSLAILQIVHLRPGALQKAQQAGTGDLNAIIAWETYQAANVRYICNPFGLIHSARTLII
jgi:hypothetical protein